MAASPSCPTTCCERFRREDEPKAAPNGEAGAARSADEDAKVRDALGHIRSDERETWFQVGAALHWTGWESARSIWDGWSATSAKFDRAGQDKAWSSFGAYAGKPITLATLFKLAAEHGWKNPGKAKAPAELVSICAADVEIGAVSWLWENRFSLETFGLIAGLPDEGKGQIIQHIAARVTVGGLWPCGEGRAPLGSVVYLQAEDNLGKTVVPRLMAAGADLTRVHLMNMMKEEGKERMFSLQNDLEPLRQKILDVGDVKLALIDPVSAYMGVGKVDSYRTTDVRAVLAPLVRLAEETQVAVIGILHFNKKIDVTNALLRISDSLAFGATARHVYGAIDDKENDRKLLVKAKNNLAERGTGETLAYRFSSKCVGADKKTGEVIVAPFIEWGAEYVDISAAEAMSAAANSRSPGAGEQARTLLRDLLSKGAMPQKDVEEAAKAEGISMITLRRAKQKLGIRARKEGDCWFWEFPAA